MAMLVWGRKPPSIFGFSSEEDPTCGRGSSLSLFPITPETVMFFLFGPTPYTVFISLFVRSEDVKEKG
jgi:hypothetical protein